MVDKTDIYNRYSLRLQGEFMKDLISELELDGINLKCVDLGCGTGSTTTMVAKKLGKEGVVIGIDPMEERIKTAKVSNFNKNITYHCAKGSDVCKYAHDVDLVFSNTVVHWMNNEEKELTFYEVFKCLKPGGEICFNTAEGVPKHYEVFLKAYPDHTATKQVHTNLHLMPAEFYKSLCKKIGFEEIRVIHFELKTEFPGTLDEYFELMASSLYSVSFTDYVDLLRTAYSKKKFVLKFSDKGHVMDEMNAFKIYAKKPF